MSERALTRSEAKAATRQRLLDVALRILDEEGEAGLTTTAVTRRAGIAQSSFYVHFSDMDDLLRELIDNLWRQHGRATRSARQRSRSGPYDYRKARDTFRVPLSDLLAHPAVFRLVLRSRLDPASSLGEWTRSVLDTNRKGLVEDLIAMGVPHETEAQRRKVEMIADGLIALIDSFALGHLEGRYDDLEEIIDVLMLFSAGYFSQTPAGRRAARRRRERLRRELEAEADGHRDSAGGGT